MLVSRHLCRTAFVLALISGVCVSQALAGESQWVQRGSTGRLVYVPDAQGDRIPDFSDVGYRGGKVSIPTIATAVVVNPVAGDDTSSIQAAIDAVSNLPLGPDGFRGAVELAAGDYEIGGQLNINASGVVLRGSGRDIGGTRLIATGTSQRELIQIAGSGSQSLTGSTRQMVDKVVPVGSRSFRVNTTSGFSVGDTVRVTRPSTANWISDLGMDMIPPRDDGGTVNQWQAGSFDIRYDRVITRIEGDRIFVDAPLTNSFEQQYGGGQIRRYTWASRIENVGVENLRAESTFTSDTDEDHSWTFVSIDDAQHVWVRDTTSAHFADSAVLSNPSAKWVTVDNAINLDPKSQITGGRRYTFDLSGQLELVTNSEANEGRHDFVNNSTRPAGPHVFHNSVANNALDEAGPHQRWATGSLFDNIVVDGDQINARNRGNFGTGHGWAGANMVIWNSTAESFIVQNPPTAQNWLVGSTGSVIDDTTFGPQPMGYIDSHGDAIDEIDSLYEAQIADASDVTEFHFGANHSNWNDADAWQERLTPGGYEVETRDYLIGDIDDFTDDGAGSVDEAFIDAAWEAFILGSSPHGVTGFDDTPGNKNVAFTIQHQLDAGERVVHGTLAFSLTANGGSVSGDFLRLFDSDANHLLTFSDLGWDTGLAANDPFVGVVDLSPFTDELQSGSVNVQLSQNSSADWAIYTVTVASPLASPSAANVFIDGGGDTTVDTAITGVGNLSVGGDAAGGLILDSTGSVDLAGDYTQNSNGTLGVELDSIDNGLLTIGGDANLDGQLNVTLEGSFDPSIGDSFQVIDAAGVLSGEFSGVSTPGLVAGLGWRTTYGASSVLLSVVLSGDYNGDGTVDAADYTVWRDSVGSTTNLAADGDNNGIIDAADYAVWTSSFGLSESDFATASSSGSLPVPEPTSLMLFTTIATLLAMSGQRRSLA